MQKDEGRCEICDMPIQGSSLRCGKHRNVVVMGMGKARREGEDKARRDAENKGG